MDMEIILLHGAYGNPKENWFPWLRHELEKRGHSITTPAFPTPENQSYASWKTILDNLHIKDGSIIVGHSLGVVFALNFLSEKQIAMKACFFVAGFVSSLGNERFDSINRTFIDRKLDWKALHPKLGKVFMYWSPDDPYVPERNAKELERSIAPYRCRELKGAGHFNENSGFTTFPLLLKDILSIER